MLSHNLKNLIGTSFKCRQFIGHIKNMNEENIRVEAQNVMNNPNILLNTNRVYKPTYTIEFNR